MVERKSDSQGPPKQPVNTDAQLIIETRRYIDLFTPSPLEEAFDAEMQRRFHTSLLEPAINNHDYLVRVSYPVITGNSMVAFQYSRYDLLKDDEKKVARILLSHNPSIRNSLGDIEDLKHAGQKEWLGKLENVMDQEKKVIEAVRQRIIERDGSFDPKKALNDPTYYTEGASIEQWPESFEFVIFDSANNFTHYVPPSPIERNGRLAGRRASIYGALSIPAYFRDEAHPLKEQEVHLIISYPQLDYETARAYLQAFEGGNPEDYKAGGLDVDDYDSFGLRPKIIVPLFVSRSPKNIQETIGGIGNFVSGLTHQNKQQ